MNNRSTDDLLKKEITLEQDRLRHLIKSPFCDDKYNDFLAGKIQTLDWVLLQIDRLYYERLGMRVSVVKINDKIVGFKE